MQVRNISISEITPSELNPRKSFDQESLEELAQNIKENGLIQPITVRKTKKGNEFKYEIVCGERRYRATLLAGLDSIDCLVKDLDDKQAFAAMIIENLQRKDVDPMEEAAAFSKLISEKTMKVKEIAKLMGKSSSYVISRYNLANIIPSFEQLMRDGTLYLVHLLEICKLTHEQQETLYVEKFSPESIARWTKKILPLDDLHKWIDECVMKYLDTARFDVLDESLGCKNCEGCKFNTKNKKDEYKDTRFRCMKPSCFSQKTLMYVIREAKLSGLSCVCQGKNNEATIKFAKEQGVDVLDFSGREYIPVPVAPDRSKFNDEEYYAKRMQTYNDSMEVLNSNIADGTIEKVYEICYDGKVSGEVKYAYHVPENTEPSNVQSVVETKERISRLKDSLIKNREAKRLDIVESQREALAESNYSDKGTFLSKNEEIVFHALLMKHLSYAFKKSIGVDWDSTSDTFLNNAEAVESKRNNIKREFIKKMLSEKTVLFSNDMAGMLELLVHEFMPSNKEAEEKISAKYDKKSEEISESITALKEIEQDVPAEEASETE